MHVIECPWCGPRFESEFAYGGDATVTRPADPSDAQAMYEYAYLRNNPRGPHLEWWHHVAGCRAWIKVKRDTWTHEILATARADTPLSSDTADEPDARR